MRKLLTILLFVPTLAVATTTCPTPAPTPAPAPNPQQSYSGVFKHHDNRWKPFAILGGLALGGGLVWEWGRHAHEEGQSTSDTKFQFGINK